MVKKKRDDVLGDFEDASGSTDLPAEAEAETEADPVEKEYTYEALEPPKELSPAEAAAVVAQTDPPSVKLPVWAAVCGQKIDQLAGFVSWSRKHCPERLPLADWGEKFEAFLRRPVR